MNSARRAQRHFVRSEQLSRLDAKIFAAPAATKVRCALGATVVLGIMHTTDVMWREGWQAAPTKLSVTGNADAPN
jgi:hypothetical protein